LEGSRRDIVLHTGGDDNLSTARMDPDLMGTLAPILQPPEAVLLKKEPELPTIERQPSYGHLLLRLGGVTRKPKL